MAISSTSKLITLGNLTEFKTKYTDNYIGEIKDKDGKLQTVKAYVDAAQAAATFDPSTLKNTDAAVDHQFVTAAVEANGIVTVSRAALVADDIPSLTLSKISDAGTAAAATVETTALAEDTESTALPTSAQVATFVKNEVAGLEGALHFRGIKTSTSEITDPASGDVVIVGTTEYIYDGTEWKELGDEGNYVPKTRTIAGVDLVDNITASEMITALGIDYSGKADKVASATSGNFAGLDADGNLTDSGKKAADFDAAGTAAGLVGTIPEKVGDTETKTAVAYVDAKAAVVDAKVEALTEATNTEVDALFA